MLWRNAEPASQFDAGDAVLALCEVVDGRKPSGEGKFGGMKNRAGDQRNLVMTTITLVNLAALELAIGCASAPWTRKALGPAPLEQSFPALILAPV